MLQFWLFGHYFWAMVKYKFGTLYSALGRGASQFVLIFIFYCLDTDMQNLLSNGQFHEAILPLPNCRFNSGCRSVMISAQDPKKKDFNLNDEFFISGNVTRSFFFNLKTFYWGFNLVG